MIYYGALDTAVYDAEDQNVHVTGWAAEFLEGSQSATNTRVDVHIYAHHNETATFIGGTTADIYRADLANRGIGDGRHGFDASFDFSSFPVGRYEIKAYAYNGPTLLNNSVYIYNGPTPYRQKIILGDLNNDGRLSIEDLQILRKAVLREDGFILQGDDLKAAVIVYAPGKTYPTSDDVDALADMLNAYSF